MPVCTSILEAVGGTPLVELNKISPSGGAKILVKVESNQVGGSIKTRTALNMLEAAERDGAIGSDAVVIEPTSGNQGIGLALVCAVKGYKCVIVMPDSCSEERIKLMQLYGAEVILVHDNGDIGECMERCLAKAAEVKNATPNGFIPQQFVNPNNPAVHFGKTAREILQQLGGRRVDAFCCGFGTGGTMTGIGRALREQFPEIRLIAAEPENAAILAGGAIGSHLQQGIGDGFIPDNLDTNILSGHLVITDEEAMQTARLLAKCEGIGAGISSGTNVACAIRLAKELTPEETVLTVLPDSCDRYFSTPLFDN